MKIGRTTKHNNLTTPEEILSCNEHNLQLLEQWVKYLKTIQRSDLTIHNYKNDIECFYVYLLRFKDNKRFVDITVLDIIDFQNYCMFDINLSAARVRRLKDCLASFSNYIKLVYGDQYGDIKKIIREIPNPQNEKVRKETKLTPEIVEGILNQLLLDKQYQTACVFALCIYSNINKFALRELQSDFCTKKNIVYDAFYKTPEPIKVKGRNRTFYVLREPVERFVYLLNKDKKKNGLSNFEYMFYTSGIDGDTRQLQTHSLTWMAEKITKIMNQELGLNEVFYWNCTSKYFEEQLKKTNIPEKILKEILNN